MHFILSSECNKQNGFNITPSYEDRQKNFDKNGQINKTAY